MDAIAKAKHVKLIQKLMAGGGVAVVGVGAALPMIMQAVGGSMDGLETVQPVIIAVGVMEIAMAVLFPKLIQLGQPKIPSAQQAEPAREKQSEQL